MTTKTKVHKGGGFHWVGNGFPVRSIFSYSEKEIDVSPFLLLDYAAPFAFSPGTGRRGVGAHPHKGFETVTLTYQGEVEHRDSSGAGGKIGPDDVQWMTAGNGIVHEEFHSREFVGEGGIFEVIQLWVNLPAKYKGEKAGYQTLTRENIPSVSLEDNAGLVRVVAGDFRENKGPAKTFTPINIWDARLNANKVVEFSFPKGHNKFVFVLNGDVTVDGQKVANAELAVIDPDASSIKVETRSEAKLLVLSGEPINEPVVGYGPFVMNTQAEIKEAYAQYQMGEMGVLD